MKNMYTQFSSILVILATIHCSSSKSGDSINNVDSGDASLIEDTVQKDSNASTRDVSLSQNQDCTDVGSGWCQWNLGLTQNLYKICGISPNQMWAVGESGTVLQWDGAKWSHANFSENIDLYDIWCQSSSSIWVAGQKGSIFEFDGYEWKSKKLSVDASVFGIQVQNGRFYAVGNDGLMAFQDSSMITQIASINGVTPVLSGTSSVRQGINANLRDIAGNWLAGRNGYLFEYTSWDSYPYFNPNSSSCQSVAPCYATKKVGEQDFQALWADKNDAWAVGNRGTVYQNSYNNRWGEWKQNDPKTQADLWGVWQNNPNDVWLVGASGTISYYNGSWSVKPLNNIRSDLRGIWGSGPTNVWAVGTNGTVLQYKR